MNSIYPVATAANALTSYKYMVRVEMVDASWNEYELLHQGMALLGFEKTIVGDNGLRYRLPDAEYVGASPLLVTVLRDVIQRVADGVKLGGRVVVTHAGAIAWSLPLAS